MVSFERCEMKDVSWEDMQNVGEVNIFQSPLWINLIAEKWKAEPVIVKIKSDDQPVGYFTGAIIRKYGLKILASPFRYWWSYFMGFNLNPNASRSEILKAFPQYAFKELGCHYLEIIDPYCRSCDTPNLSYKIIEELHWYVLDLTKSEDEIFANMKSACRSNIRKAFKEGVVIEEATDLEFADDYFAQYSQVLDKHDSSLFPYDINFLRKMIQLFLPSGNLLLLRAREMGGKCIATGMFLNMNKTAVFWGAASWREYQYLRPNEALAWYGIKCMKKHNIEELHLSRFCRQYKEKFGCYNAKLLRLMEGRNGLVNLGLQLTYFAKKEDFRKEMLQKFSGRQLEEVN